MDSKATRSFYECLIRIRNSPDMSPFRDYLQAEIAKATKNVVSQDKPKHVFRAQGAVRVLEDMQKLIMDSDKILDQYLKSAPQQRVPIE